MVVIIHFRLGILDSIIINIFLCAFSIILHGCDYWFQESSNIAVNTLSERVAEHNAADASRLPVPDSHHSASSATDTVESVDRLSIHGSHTTNDGINDDVNTASDNRIEPIASARGMNNDPAQSQHSSHSADNQDQHINSVSTASYSTALTSLISVFQTGHPDPAHFSSPPLARHNLMPTGASGAVPVTQSITPCPDAQKDGHDATPLQPVSDMNSAGMYQCEFICVQWN